MASDSEPRKFFEAPEAPPCRSHISGDQNVSLLQFQYKNLQIATKHL